jgi:hypothetical protein
MIVLKNILNQNEIDIIRENVKYTSSDMFITKYHSNDIKKLINYSDIHYGDKDSLILKPILSKIINQSEKIYSVHWIKYCKGDKTLRHLDRASFKTYIFLLTSDFIGGELLVDGIDTNLKKGDVAIFKGNKQYHEVNEIVYGEREVLVVWTGNSHDYFII